MNQSTLAPTENSIRQEMIHCLRRLDDPQLDPGKNSSLSVRWHRGAADGMLLAPSTVERDRLMADDLHWVPLEPPGQNGMERDSTNQDSSPAQWRVHRAIYRHPDQAETNVILHLNSVFASTLACLPQIQSAGIPAFHEMIATAGGNSIRCAPYALLGNQACCENLLEAMRGRRACLLANHGQFVVGNDLGSAFILAARVETLSRLYWQALQVGTPSILTDQQMQAVLDTPDYP